MAKTAYASLLIFALVVILILPASAAMDIIPCAVGNKWSFNCYKILQGTVHFQGKTMAQMNDASYGSSVYEVLGADTKTSPAVYDYLETTEMHPANGQGKTDTEKVQLKIVNDKTNLRILSTCQEGSGDKKPETQTYDPSLFYYSADAISGKTWEVGTMRDGDTKTMMTARGAGKETVTVPAGTFKDCLKIVYSSEDISGTFDMWGQTFTVTSGRHRGIYWIADGVGVVKELEASVSSAEAPGPDGTPVTIETSVCTLSELKPGYTVKSN